MPDGRAGDTDMYLARSGIPQQLDQWSGGVAAYNRIIHHDDTLTPDGFLDHVVFQCHALFAQEVGRFDEGAPDITILDKTILYGMPDAWA